jgi:predicted DsbA family dithiol-disulfide isomerase
VEKNLSKTTSRIIRQEPDSIFVVIARCVAVLAALVISATAAFAGSDSSRTVAIVDGHAITQQDLDTTIAPELYQLRLRQLDHFIDDYLLEQAAKRAHLSIPEYLAKETAVTVSDAEARAQYEQHKGLMRLPFVEFKPRIIAALTSQRQAAREAALRAKLRTDAHIEMKLEPPRLEVAIAHSPSLGPASAPVTIIEFGDFQSPVCATEESALKQVHDRYKDQVRLIYKDFPILASKDSAKAAEAARCANEQGEFWQFKDALYADQSKLSISDLKATAQRLGLDSTKFDSCLESGKYASAVEGSIEEGLRLGVRSAPTFFVNGYPHAGPQSIARFQSMIESELEGKSRTQTKSH